MTEPPELTAYITPAPRQRYIVWCGHCKRWHRHGTASLGHRVAHCAEPHSPYASSGYILVGGEPAPTWVLKQFEEAAYPINDEPTVFEPNQWDVTMEAADADILEDLKRWEWAGETDPVAIALIVMQAIREQTMAFICLEDSDRVSFHLFETVPISVSFTALIDDWIDARKDGGDWIENSEPDVIAGVTFDDQEATRTAELADRLEALAAKLRGHLKPVTEETHNGQGDKAAD